MVKGREESFLTQPTYIGNGIGKHKIQNNKDKSYKLQGAMPVTGQSWDPKYTDLDLESHETLSRMRALRHMNKFNSDIYRKYYNNITHEHSCRM